MRRFGLKGSNLFETVKWLIDHPNLIGIYFGYPEELCFEWLPKKKSVDNMLFKSSSYVWNLKLILMQFP